jgi:hypothetical protein
MFHPLTSAAREAFSRCTDFQKERSPKDPFRLKADVTSTKHAGHVAFTWPAVL